MGLLMMNLGAQQRAMRGNLVTTMRIKEHRAAVIGAPPDPQPARPQ